MVRVSDGGNGLPNMVFGGWGDGKFFLNFDTKRGEAPPLSSGPGANISRLKRRVLIHRMFQPLENRRSSHRARELLARVQRQGLDFNQLLRPYRLGDYDHEHEHKILTSSS